MLTQVRPAGCVCSPSSADKLLACPGRLAGWMRADLPAAQLRRPRPLPAQAQAGPGQVPPGHRAPGEPHAPDLLPCSIWLLLLLLPALVTTSLWQGRPDKTRREQTDWSRGLCCRGWDGSEQALLAILDSPLNKAGRLKALYVKTDKNVLIQVNPHIRIPRTFKRFCGLMGE